MRRPTVVSFDAGELDVPGRSVEHSTEVLPFVRSGILETGSHSELRPQVLRDRHDRTRIQPTCSTSKLVSKLTFADHISLLTRSCHYQLRSLRAIRRSVSAKVFLTHNCKCPSVHALTIAFSCIRLFTH